MKKRTFTSIFDHYIAYHQKTTNPFDRRSKTTIAGYRNKFLLVTQFLTDQNIRRIAPHDFKVPLAKKYLEYLLQNYNHNYAARCVAICSTVLDFAVNNEMADHNPLSSFVVPKLPPKRPTYFTIPQIEKWERYRSHSAIKQKAADLFVLIMHTGFDYGDLEEIGRHHIAEHKGVRYIIKKRHKNGNEAIIPLSLVADEILEKYNYRMRLISNPKFNAAIKEVARELDMNIYLTAKSGRKIYAMNKLNNEGYTMESTSKMLGHRSIKTTEQTYAQVNIELVHKEVSSK